MNGDLSFNTEKLTEVYDELNRLHSEYKEILFSLNCEVNKMENTWGTSPKSTYKDFKEKYIEKKSKLEETESMMSELLEVLNTKKQEIENATLSSTSSFE